MFSENLLLDTFLTHYLMSSQSEPEIRSLIRIYTSHAALEEENGDHTPISTFHFRYSNLFLSSILTALPVTRMLVQALSNLVTANDVLTQQLWGTYLNFPMEEVILMYAITVSHPPFCDPQRDNYQSIPRISRYHDGYGHPCSDIELYTYGRTSNVSSCLLWYLSLAFYNPSRPTIPAERVSNPSAPRITHIYDFL